MQPATSRTAAHCARCGYANAATWPSCISCGRSLRSAPRSFDRAQLAGLWPATRLVPACASATIALALVTEEPQRTELLLLAGIAATVTLAALGCTSRPALAPANVAARTVVATQLSDDDVRAALAAW